MTSPPACVFCEILAGRAPATVVAEWPEALAIVPLGPVVDGHVLVIPRVHVEDAATNPAVTAITFGFAARYAREQRRPFNLITSAGPEATQSVTHLHAHYLPRAAGDGLVLPWGDNTRHVTGAEQPAEGSALPRAPASRTGRG
ncbi:HIT family protein [Pseudonocardia zijingensis]|uniref:HIT family protein n=1 Tax=Pseudonocardia zijingensis TaxID=153376 RepID=UPI0031CFC418